MDGTLDAQRLIELEIKSALADDALDQLSQTLFRQQEQLDALAKEVIRLRDLISRIEADSPRSLRDELPPHY
ncbi:MAG: SlyX family protein [Burkholderiaceae bacterium]|nr:SlyX family protein [Burkholderiaceae bacterium]